MSEENKIIRPELTIPQAAVLCHCCAKYMLLTMVNDWRDPISGVPVPAKVLATIAEAAEILSIAAGCEPNPHLKQMIEQVKGW